MAASSPAAVRATLISINLPDAVEIALDQSRGVEQAHHRAVSRQSNGTVGLT
jgi:hypothetical protein